VRQRIGVRGIKYCGLYGWESRERMNLPTHSQWLLDCARSLLAWIPPLPGVRLEDKGASLALHFRLASAPAIRELRKCIREIVARLGPEGLHVIAGSKVLELVPPQIRGKGAAVRDIMRGLQPGLLPIYVGDEPSDEAAFAALPTGITVRVGPARKTAARYTLRNSKQVTEFLKRLEALLEETETQQVGTSTNEGPTNGIQLLRGVPHESSQP
jgi:trehalose-phosphatase